MATIHEEGERIALSSNDTRILTALLAGPMNTYQIGTQCQADARSIERMSNGALRPSLKSLKAMHLVSEAGKIFRITSLGREILSWEQARLSRITLLIRKRSK